jgi:hypothetical protein
MLVLAGLSLDADAHLLPGDASTLQQVSHQWTSLHHIPGFFLVLIACGLAVIAAKAWSARKK